MKDERPLPSVTVLEFKPELTYSVWIDLIHRCRTRRGLIKQLCDGIKTGRWVGYRLIHKEFEILGLDPNREGEWVQKGQRWTTAMKKNDAAGAKSRFT